MKNRTARLWRLAIQTPSPRPAPYPLRPARSADAQALAALCSRAFQATPDAATENVFLDKINGIFSGRYGVFIQAASFVYALNPKEIAAAILTTDYAPYGCPVIAVIAVAPELQRTGLGTALVGCSVQTLVQQGQSACCACISVGHSASENLFRSCGFKPVC